MKPEISPAAHLNPCPCCGGEASFQTRESKYNTIAMAVCDVCQLQSRVFATELSASDDEFDFSDVAYKIAALWNRRTSLDEAEANKAKADADNEGPKIYLLSTPIYPGYKKFIRYIRSALPQERLEDIIVGLDFYVHDVIRGSDREWSGIPEDHIVYFLSENFGCTEATKQEWKEQSGSRPEIDIFTARRKRYNKNHQDYIDIITPYEGTPFIEAYRRLEDAKAERDKNTQPDQLIQKFFSDLDASADNDAETCSETPEEEDTAHSTDGADGEYQIYQIYFPAPYPDFKINARYVASMLSQKELEQIIVGFIAYLEKQSGKNSFFHMKEDFLVYFLTYFSYASLSTKQAWEDQKGEQPSINLIKARANLRKSNEFFRYVEPFEALYDNPLIEAYVDYYKSPSAYPTNVTAEELVSRCETLHRLKKAHES